MCSDPHPLLCAAEWSWQTLCEFCGRLYRTDGFRLNRYILYRWICFICLSHETSYFNGLYAKVFNHCRCLLWLHVGHGQGTRNTCEKCGIQRHLSFSRPRSTSAATLTPCGSTAPAQILSNFYRCWSRYLLCLCSLILRVLILCMLPLLLSGHASNLATLPSPRWSAVYSYWHKSSSFPSQQQQKSWVPLWG